MLYLILLVFLVIGYFYPIIGFAAFICMVAPVWMSVYRGRFWCGNYCPRGSYYDKLISKISRNKQIPRFLRNKYFRTFMVFFIFTMFGVQMYAAWGNWSMMGKVFWNIIFITTVVGTILGIVYSPRAWCTFCPMGSLSALAAPRKPKAGFQTIKINESCVLCKRCKKVCPMQLEVYQAKGVEEGLMDKDCIKCGVCTTKCPKKAMQLK